MGLCYSVDRTTGKEPGEASSTATTAETVEERSGSGRWRRPRDLKGGGDIEGIPQVLGRLVSNGSSKIACLYTQQGKKGTNQDAMLVFEVRFFYLSKNSSFLQPIWILSILKRTISGYFGGEMLFNV
ncbi:hypothetical protein AXX17_AT1G74450 [Arabidopsis thaliana]|uniref:Uncharacterized protein n=1 Tax=Arabidopsis thaliana TaxID=3702 RepID=A0A178W2J8_ARATH|nr:hypothetical protein AXX17_AT1G74450 [Arabidopsis thaliana]